MMQLIAGFLFWSIGGVGAAAIVTAAGPPNETPQWVIAMKACREQNLGSDTNCWESKLVPCPSQKNERYCRTADGVVWARWYVE